jgi:hypothetical protein
LQFLLQVAGQEIFGYIIVMYENWKPQKEMITAAILKNILTVWNK